VKKLNLGSYPMIGLFFFGGLSFNALTYDWAFLFPLSLKIGFHRLYKGEGNVGEGGDLFGGEAFFQ
jgi:hypothetical protein